MSRAVVVLSTVALVGLPGAIVHGQDREPGEWTHYGGDAGGSRYSPLPDIRVDNVGGLRVVWTARTGERGQDARDGGDLTFETTPILFSGSLILTTGFGVVIALDPVSGVEKWRHDPRVPRNRSYSEVTSRGAAVWTDPEARDAEPCARRVLYGTIDARLIAVDAGTGEPCTGFGDAGAVDLAGPLEMEIGDYQVTSAPAVVGSVVVVGTSIGDNWSVDTGTGVVRGFDARTGRELWRWDPISRVPGRVGAANAWSTLAADPDRDLVFVPTSSPSPDFFGGLREGEGRWANSVVALRASTGELVWGFQTVHHDLWDYDVAAQPSLVTVRRDGGDVPALAQAAKTGFLFVLHRETGEPLFEVAERPVPASDVPGERASTTQPVPSLPAPLVPVDVVDPAAPWGPTPEDREACREMAAGLRWEGAFTPPSTGGTIMFPGNGAGTNWGSTAWDPGSGTLFVPTNRFATLVRLIPRDVWDRDGRAARRWQGSEMSRQDGAPFAMERTTWIGPSRLPCTPPPWGTLNAVDLASGELRWSVPVGIAPDGHTRGMPAFGGPLVTGGGLVFLGSYDGRLYAFEASTGAEVWSAELPFAPIATPMTYRGADGRQYVVVAAGGHGKMGLEIGDAVVAFALSPR